MGFKTNIRYLPKDYRALYNARQILMSNSYGVDDAISKVPSNLKSDIGLRYDRLNGEVEEEEQNLLEIIDQAPLNKDELVRADLWWKQRNIISRSLIYKKNIKKLMK